MLRRNLEILKEAKQQAIIHQSIDWFYNQLCVCVFFTKHTVDFFFLKNNMEVSFQFGSRQ